MNLFGISRIQQAFQRSHLTGFYVSAESFSPAAFMAHNYKTSTTPQPVGEPQPLGVSRWDWSSMRRVLVVRLRSIGDTVLATPSLHALRRFLPDARIDIVLEDWVAPLLDGFKEVDNVITVERKSIRSRAMVARALRTTRYDVAYNLHGGTTATFMTRATGATHRVGYADYRYSGFYNHAAPSPIGLFGRDKIHSVEQQIALLGWTGVPVSDLPPTRLYVTLEADASIDARLNASGIDGTKPIALIHPAAAFDTKQWATENFARITEYLSATGLLPIAIVGPNEGDVASKLKEFSTVPIVSFTDLALPEVTALAARSQLFVGNDSGIAHIAAAVNCPTVVIFGSSNITHWRPWSRVPSATVREELPCQPCPGYTCAEFDEPQCIRRVPVERVRAAIETVRQMSDVGG